MALRLEGKKEIVAEVADVAKNAISAVAAEYIGLTVAEMTELRKEARNAGVYLRVVRNTLAKRAIADTDFSCMQDSLVGPLVFAFSNEEPGAAARIVRDFAKKHENLKAKVLSIGGELIDGKDIDRLASLPTKEVGLSQLMSVMLAPITKLVRTFAEPYAQVTRTVAAVRDQKQASE